MCDQIECLNSNVHLKIACEEVPHEMYVTALYQCRAL